jgi:hypothetical protein
MDKHVVGVFNALTKNHKIKTATVYISPKQTLKLTRQGRDKRSSHHTYLLTIGKPNYAEREHIQSLLKAKEPFPVKKIRLKFYPEKKKA